MIANFNLKQSNKKAERQEELENCQNLKELQNWASKYDLACLVGIEKTLQKINKEYNYLDENIRKQWVFDTAKKQILKGLEKYSKLLGEANLSIGELEQHKLEEDFDGFCYESQITFTLD